VSVHPFGLGRAAEIIAHRGFSAQAPENTLTALTMGISAGADAVEFDLHTTRDGEPVLLHDATLDRTTDRAGPVARYTLAELVGTDAGGWFSETYADEPLPSLAEALDRISRSDVRIYAEVKRSSGPEGLARAVALVAETDLQRRTVFISMDWEALETIRATEPRALIGYIVERPWRTDKALERARGDDRALVDFDARILLADPTIARRASELGVPLATWTVDSITDAGSLLEMGVPRITTNEVASLVAWRDTL
jgi:glycerophosphoryl diester phosphodiesterase